MYTLKELESRDVFRYFTELSTIPRPSGHEERVRAWVIDYAKKWNRTYKEDRFGNILVRVPANSHALEGAASVAIQCHLDMVCEKDAEKEFNFLTDSLELELLSEYKGEQWLTAAGTTLGADNGIAVAMAMELMSRHCSAEHGPLELLFTLEEEIGLTGAANLGSDMLSSRYLINIDNSDEGFFCIGCAGGRDFISTVPYASNTVKEGLSPCAIVVDGLAGGHSGMEIFDGRANALKILEWVLSDLLETNALYISSLEGGKQRNAIPRFALAQCWLEDKESISAAIQQCRKQIVSEFPSIDKRLSIQLEAAEPATASKEVFSPASLARILRLLRLSPHGVLYRKGLDSLGTTMSNNLASMRTENGKVCIINNGRFLSATAEKYLSRVLNSVFSDDDIQTLTENSYEAWQPNTESLLQAFFVTQYKKIFATDPVVAPVHAGIECAKINERVGFDLDMISFGPNIEFLHSPQERVSIDSTFRTWNFLKEILKHFLSMKTL